VPLLLNICTDLLKQTGLRENVMKLSIMGDEMRVCGYDVESHLLASQEVIYKIKKSVQIKFVACDHCFLQVSKFGSLHISS